MSENTALIARSLVDSRALKFGNFKLKSGVTSPYYIDLTWLLSSPEDFKRVVSAVAHYLENLKSSITVEKLASIELKGALLLPSIASQANMPCIILRKEMKGYGLTGRIAGGEVKKGERFILFDDVITDGESKLEAIRAIEDAGGRVEAVLVVVDREQGGKKRLEELGYKVYSITTISEIAENLILLGAISPEKAEEIREYVKNQSN
jgi:uridine monophosphate synthetase